MSGIINSVGSRSGVISDTEMGKDFSGALDIVGMIASFGMTSPPTGWIPCVGGEYSRTVTYSALFSAIGTTWGTGDGSSTFNVPDLRAAFLRGAGTSVLFTSDQTITHAAEINDQLQGHIHTFSQIMNDGTYAFNGEIHSAQNGSTAVTTNGTAGMNGLTTLGSDGTPRSGNETRPSNIGVTFFIKY